MHNLHLRAAVFGPAATRPVPLAATTTGIGDGMVLTFSEPVTRVGGGTGGFVLTASGGGCVLTVVSVTGATITFSIDRGISPIENATLAYTPGSVAGVGGVSVVAFAEFVVTNG